MAEAPSSVLCVDPVRPAGALAHTNEFSYHKFRVFAV